MMSLCERHDFQRDGARYVPWWRGGTPPRKCKKCAKAAHHIEELDAEWEEWKKSEGGAGYPNIGEDFDLVARDLRDARARIASLEADVERLTKEKERFDKWREREAECCPEDMAFDEVIEALRADVERLTRERDGYRNGQGQVQHICDGLMDANDAWAKDAKASIARAEKAERERDEARETIKRLNRRVQEAEAGLKEKIAQQPNRSFGRALANAAASMYLRERDELAAALRDAVGWMEDGDARPTIKVVLARARAALAKIGSNDAATDSR